MQLVDIFNEASALGADIPVAVDQDRRTRYYFYAGDEPGMDGPGGLSVQTICVPRRKIYRGQVTPLVTAMATARKVEIPEGRMIPGSEFGGGLAKYWLFAGAEGSQLLSDYGNPQDSSKNWGLVELVPLRGMTSDDVRALNITYTFFPSWPDLPETNAEMLNAAELAIARIKEDKSNPNREIILECGDLIRRSILAAQRRQEDIVSSTNLAVTLPSTEPGYKRDFDERDQLYSVRTGIPLATNTLRSGSTNMVEQLVAKLQPQAPTIDPAQIAAIVAATVQAIRESERGERTESQPSPPKQKKAA